jgi:predicted amidophosphoribosyltransferase
MKAFKRAYGFSFSVILLLSFSTVLFPLDFLHNHSPVPVSSCSKQLNSSSTENVNVQNKTDYCWVCAVHIDKTFTKASFYEKLRLSPMMCVFLKNEVTTYFAKQLFPALRGPPFV